MRRSFFRVPACSASNWSREASHRQRRSFNFRSVAENTRRVSARVLRHSAEVEAAPFRRRCFPQPLGRGNVDISRQTSDAREIHRRVAVGTSRPTPISQFLTASLPLPATACVRHHCQPPFDRIQVWNGAAAAWSLRLRSDAAAGAGVYRLC